MTNYCQDSDKKKDSLDNNFYIKILWMYWEQGIENILDSHFGKYNKKFFDRWKKLWMYFGEQGIANILDDHQREYNKMCFDGWKKLNPDWDIRILNKKTALEYVPELKNYDHLSIQHRSDILRIKLLEKYGGVWADASTLPMKPLTGWIEDCDNGTGIFFYRYHPTNLKSKKSRAEFDNLYLKGLSNEGCSYIASWFIVSKQPNNYLIKKFANTFEERHKDKSKKYPYFDFHYTLTYLVNNDQLIKNSINKLTIDAMPLRAYFFKKYTPIKHDKGLHKPLCYKRYLKVNHKDYYDYINTFDCNILNVKL